MIGATKPRKNLGRTIPSSAHRNCFAFLECGNFSKIETGTEGFIDGQIQKGPGARRPNPERSYCRRLWAGGAILGLVLLPREQNPLSVPGQMYSGQGGFAVAQR